MILEYHPWSGSFKSWYCYRFSGNQLQRKVSNQRRILLGISAQHREFCKRVFSENVSSKSSPTTELINIENEGQL